MAQKETHVSVRLPRELVAQIDDMAIKAHRNRPQQLLRLLELGIKQEELSNVRFTTSKTKR